MFSPSQKDSSCSFISLKQGHDDDSDLDLNKNLNEIHTSQTSAGTANYSILPMDVIVDILSFLILSKQTIHKYCNFIQSAQNKNHHSLFHLFFGYKNWDIYKTHVMFLYRHFVVKGDLTPYESFSLHSDHQKDEQDGFIMNFIFRHAHTLKVDYCPLTDAYCQSLSKNKKIERFTFIGNRKHYHPGLCSALRECNKLKRITLDSVYDWEFTKVFELPSLTNLKLNTGMMLRDFPPRKYNFDFIVDIEEGQEGSIKKTLKNEFSTSRLKHLSLISSDGFTDEYSVTNLMKLPVLEVLFLENQKITKQSMQSVGQSSVREFVFERCLNFSDSGMEKLMKVKLPNLSKLTLSSCGFNTSNLKKVFTSSNGEILNQLTYIDLSKNQNIKDTAFSKLNSFKFEKLATLDLNHCVSLSSSGILMFMNSFSETIQTLKLRECSLDENALVAILKSCPKLQRLDLEMNNISCTNIDVSEIEDLSNLHYLTIEKNNLTDIEWLIEIPLDNLQRLNLSDNPLGDEQANKVLKKFSGYLKYLIMERCDLSYEFLEGIENISPNCLEGLRLTGNDLSDEAVAKIMKCYPKLKKFFISDNKRITFKSLQTLLNDQTVLKLDLFWYERCPLISNDEKKFFLEQTNIPFVRSGFHRPGGSPEENTDE
ncbi:hypothetical protein FDP41_009047 [Naegleria fowleri]|uniref:F-box domain-containing protein n=1 Tax=Naegleria fowleri TaxID=5763 RepID=A0A6A5BFP7_NAEFO|nr:uncharacterized protein FDP41_009047 [Naegleria fowleri]KAF0972798.1 hypothetical protein FDP41_009047 [Naegleria fowleri]CAG4719573.1 unnamed protein product [Naegleria fowleri]